MGAAYPGQSQVSPVAAALRRSSRAFIALAIISGIINILMLTGSVFMIQIYDRVLSSRSLPTLAALSVIAITAYVFQGGLDAIRSRILALIGERIDFAVGPDVYKAVAEMPLRPEMSGREETLQPFRDLEAIRSFMSGTGPVALFDMPWLPVYLLLCYLFHPVLGYAAMLAGIILIGITTLAEMRGRGPMRRALEAQSQRNLFADNAHKGAEVVRAMGMLPALAERWQEAQMRYLAAQRSAGFVVGGLSAIAKMTRMLVQSCMLGLGAYLAIKNEISPGTIIATSILASRALSPVDQAIASWRGFVAARHGYERLRKLLDDVAATTPGVRLPAPHARLATENLFAGAPGMTKPIIRNINLKLDAGQTLGIIGPSACGKSTLARALVGIWPPLAGKVALDDAGIVHWEPARLGAHIGYLPQDVQLFDGTIGENIARFKTPLDSDAILKASSAAGFSQQILALPEGFETRIGRGGIELSAGQKQRLGLARALYGDPFLVVLDEPNSNLDAEGEAALAAAIAGVGARGGIAIVIAHRPSALAAVNFLAVMRDGEILVFGPRDEVLVKTVQNADAGKQAASRGDGLRVVQASSSAEGHK
jgi:ATP-binding cassette subfamily C protein PrsD